MATHSSVLAWRILGTGLLSMGRTESDTTEATQQQQQHSVFSVSLVKSLFFPHGLGSPIEKSVD